MTLAAGPTPETFALTTSRVFPGPLARAGGALAFTMLLSDLDLAVTSAFDSVPEEFIASAE